MGYQLATGVGVPGSWHEPLLECDSRHSTVLESTKKGTKIATEKRRHF